ncbi:MAG: ankyrin repeat domain-containing protein [Spirochaetaceae bacterium]|nr:ankyrin repeat domain-containing protein [Spirochaetaceae bacterium]
MLARQSEQLAESLGYESDNSEAIKALLEAGAKEEAVDGSGQLPFDPIAAAREALAAAGPDLLDEMPPANCEQWAEEFFFVFYTSEDIVRCISEGVGTEGALLRASKFGGPEQVKALVAAGADVNERNVSAQTPLHLAVEPLNPAFSMTWPSLARGTPMGEWHQARVTATIAALLAGGADLEARDDAGQTPLHVAASGGTSRLALVLPPELFGIAGADESAHSESRALAATVALLAAGANVESQDDGGRTPLHRAAVSGSPEIIGALLETGTSVDPVDTEGRTPLHLAAAMLLDRPANVSVLVNAGAATHVRDESGETPLHVAAKSATIVEISALVAAGAPANARNNSGETPLHVAARHGEANVIEALIEAGGDPDARDDDGRTPVFDAATRTAVEPVVALIEGGASVNARDAGARTPLHAGVKRQTLESLLAAGADPDASDSIGQTPLFYAYDPQVIAALVEAGASVGVRDAEGRTPLHGQAQWGISPEAIEALLDAGVDPSVSDIHGDQARDLAEGREELRGTEAYRRLMSR